MRANNYIRRTQQINKLKYFNLSKESKKILFLMLSKNKKYHFSINGLIHETHYTRYKIEKALKELQEKHFLILYKVRDLNGCFCGWNYYIFESYKDYNKNIIYRLETTNIKYIDKPKIEYLKKANLIIFNKKIKPYFIKTIKANLKKIIKEKLNKMNKATRNLYLEFLTMPNKTICKSIKLNSLLEISAFKELLKDSYFKNLTNLLNNNDYCIEQKTYKEKNENYIMLKSIINHFKELKKLKLSKGEKVLYQIAKIIKTPNIKLNESQKEFKINLLYKYPKFYNLINN